jgi:hypothetical protein
VLEKLLSAAYVFSVHDYRGDKTATHAVKVRNILFSNLLLPLFVAKLSQLLKKVNA